LFSFNSPYGYCEACTGLGTKEIFSEEICPKCEGKRLNENALAVKIEDKNIKKQSKLYFISFLTKEIKKLKKDISSIQEMKKDLKKYYKLKKKTKP